MKNSDMPAMPTSPNDSAPEWAAARIGGLTKREHFAGLAMQGALAADRDGIFEPDSVAKYALEVADALLKELEK